MQIVVATSNLGKLNEFAGYFADSPFILTPLTAAVKNFCMPAETGITFAANAILKAEAVAKLVPHLVLADDSGLAVEALNGAPGVWSARYAGEGASDAENNAKLLGALRDFPPTKRRAKFVCAIAAACEGKDTVVFHGECHGSIAYAAMGNGGFGYDPLFIEATTGRSFAQLLPEEKNRLSHRGLALQQVSAYLRETCTC